MLKRQKIHRRFSPIEVSALSENSHNTLITGHFSLDPNTQLVHSQITSTYKQAVLGVIGNYAAGRPAPGKTSIRGL